MKEKRLSQKFWNGIHLEEDKEEKEDLEIREFREWQLEWDRKELTTWSGLTGKNGEGEQKNVKTLILCI